MVSDRGVDSSSIGDTVRVRDEIEDADAVADRRDELVAIGGVQHVALGVRDAVQVRELERPHSQLVRARCATSTTADMLMYYYHHQLLLIC